MLAEAPAGAESPGVRRGSWPAAAQHDGDVVWECARGQADEVDERTGGGGEVVAAGDVDDLRLPGVSEQAVGGDEQGAATEAGRRHGHREAARADERLATLVAREVEDIAAADHPGSGVADARAFDLTALDREHHGGGLAEVQQGGRRDPARQS